MFVYCFSSLKFAGFPNHLRVSTMLNLSVILWTFRVSYKAATRDEDLGEIHYRMRNNGHRLLTRISASAYDFHQKLF